MTRKFEADTEILMYHINVSQEIMDITFIFNIMYHRVVSVFNQFVSFP